MRHLITQTMEINMGLDQYAFSSHEPLYEGSDGEGRTMLKPAVTTEFIWRKHAKLQEFMENLYFKGEYQGVREADVSEGLNCNPMLLDEKAIDALETCVRGEKLPKSGGGFFYGDKYQDESASDYKEQDLKFCKWAREEMKAKKHVYYDCWW